MKKCSVTLLILFSCLKAFPQNELDKKKLATDYFEKGLELRHAQKDSSYYYLDLATTYSIELENYSQALDVLLESIFASGIHYDLKRSRSYLDKMQNVLQNNAIHMASNDVTFYKNRFIYEEGSFLGELKNYPSAKSKFQELYDIYSKKDVETLDYNDLSFLIYSTNLLASIYMDLGKYDLAESYFNRSLMVVEKNKLAKDEGFDRSTYRLLAQLYINMGKYEKADVILKELLNSYKKLYAEDKEYKNSLVVVYQRLVNNFMQQDSLQKALLYLDESQEYLLDDDPFFKQSLLLYGDINLMQNNNQKAFQYFQNALEFFKKYRQYQPHEEVAQVQGKIAEFYLKQGKFQEGLDNIQKAFAAAGRNIKIDTIENNPDPQDVFSKTQLLNLLDIKLQLLDGMYTTKKDSNYLNMALSTSNDILRTFDLLKKEFDSKLDKQFLAEKAYPVFHRMLKIAHKAYEINPSNKTLKLAVNISEKNKDFLLLEALRGSQATKYGNVPNTILDTESQLRAKITYLEKENFNAVEIDDSFSEELFNLKQEYYNFLDTIKGKFPKYHNLKYQSRTLDLGMIRNKILQNNETLISFTMTPDYLYAIIVNDSDERFLKLPFTDKDRKMTRDFYQLISSPSISRTEHTISELGKTLYARILKKPLEEFDDEKLIVIADDVLHYLPFDLLKNTGENLLKTHAISYGNSINTLIELKEKQRSKTKEVLAFAPNFSSKTVVNEERKFGQLLYNDDEVAKISTYFDTEVFSDEQASLENFRTLSPKAHIVHLATHASANDEFPDYSYLAFSEEEEDHVLYIKDLYNTTLNADLVVLSACQTGIGKLQQGQGMLSLSKGFYFAGAKSLVNTLWKINDKSTVKLMEYFYEGLSEGYSKSDALRKAKLKYLKTTDDELLKHPYYWAAFVVSGDVVPIVNPISKWWWVLLAVSIVAVVWYVKKKRSTKGFQ